jgi:hypothetical protein
MAPKTGCAINKFNTITTTTILPRTESTKALSSFGISIGNTIKRIRTRDSI